MAACHAEMCLNWTGQGCTCLVMDIEPDLGEQPVGEGKDRYWPIADEDVTAPREAT